MKLEVNQLVSFVALGLLGWASLQVYQMNAQLTVTSYKVEENYNMIKPMWQDFLVRRANHYDDIKGTNSVPSFQASRKGQ